MCTSIIEGTTDHAKAASSGTKSDKDEKDIEKLAKEMELADIAKQLTAAGYVVGASEKPEEILGRLRGELLAREQEQDAKGKQKDKPRAAKGPRGRR